eukprot:g32036.t1
MTGVELNLRVIMTQNQEQLKDDDDSELILNDGDISLSFGDSTLVTTDSSYNSSSDHRNLTQSLEDAQEQDQACGGHELVIRGSHLVVPVKDTEPTLNLKLTENSGPQLLFILESPLYLVGQNQHFRSTLAPVPLPSSRS